MRINNDRPGLMFPGKAAVAARIRKPAVQCGIIGNGRGDADQNGIMSASEIVGHGLGFGARNGGGHARYLAYPAVEAASPGERKMRTVSHGSQLWVGKICLQKPSRMRWVL